MKKLLFPFVGDPITIGHIDIIRRSLALTDTLYIAIMENNTKSAMFDIQQRFQMTKKVILLDESLAKCFEKKSLQVVCHSGLLKDLAYQLGVHLIVRGIRNQDDFVYESQLEDNHHSIDTANLGIPKLDFVYLRSNSNVRSVSSTLVKSIVQYQGDISSLVPGYVNNIISRVVHGQFHITVTGSIGSGKSEFSKQLANSLQLMLASKNIDANNHKGTHNNPAASKQANQTLDNHTTSSKQKIAVSVISYDEIVSDIFQAMDRSEDSQLKEIMEENLPPTIKNISRKGISQHIAKLPVYEAKEILMLLQKLLHRPIKQAYEKKIKGLKGIIINEVPMPEEYGNSTLANEQLIYIDIDEEEQLMRLTKRYKSEKIALTRIELSKKSNEKKRLITEKRKSIIANPIISTHHDGRGGFFKLEETAEKIMKSFFDKNI